MKQEIIRKLSAAVAMSLVVGVSLAACGGSSSSTAAGVTKTGSAEGFGGAVTATLTVDANGTVAILKTGTMLAQFILNFSLRQNKSGGRFFALRSVDMFNLLGFGGDDGIQKT